MPSPIKILIVEDNPNDADLALAELRRAGFEPIWQRVDSEPAFLEKLNGDLDLVLSDYQLPDFDGFRALELLGKSGLDVPFILMSGTIGEDIAVKAMKLGASDYLMKDRLVRLGTAVHHALDQSRARRERRQESEAHRIAEAQVAQMLEHSPAVFYILKINGTEATPYLVSENIFDMLGFTVAEAMASAWWVGQLHPDDLERAKDSLSETIAAGSSLTEYRIRHRDGHYRWVDDARRLVRNAAGEAGELSGVWTDITERKRAEETVRQASGNAVRGRSRHARAEMGILLGATALMYALSVRFDIFEGITGVLIKHDNWHLDDVTVAAFFCSIGLAVFTFRRWRENQTALSGQQQVQTALGQLHEELDRRVKQRTVQLKSSNQALVTEVAGHEQTETGLKESNRRFHEMLENVELIAMTLDKGGLVTFCNDYLLGLTGWAREEVVGTDWFARFVPVSEAGVRDLFFSTINAGGIPAHHENSIATRSGELRDIAWNNTVLRDAGGDITGIASIGVDVTSRNKAEKILQESEERFRQLAENIHEVFWISDEAKGKIIYVSPAYETIWGRTCESVYKSWDTWLDAIRPEDRARVERDRRERQANGTYEEEYRIVRPDGTERWIRDRAFPVRDASNVVVRCVGVAEDITENKKMQEQFFRAQRMEAIGTLAGGIAHDLNNILAPIIMAPALLRESATTDQERRLLDLIEQSATRGAHVIRQLLTFSRGSGGERVGVQLGPLFAEMMGIMRETFPREIIIQESVPAGLHSISGDPTQLHQVIMNLCVNARDAMPEGGVLKLAARNVELGAAEVRAHPSARPGLHVAISVADTGEGIAPDNLERIFDPFFTTKALSKGTGLGLSTVLGIIRGHRGFVTVSSSLGRGTTFTIYLPAAVDAVAVPSGHPEDSAPRGHGELILVVDDEELIRTATRLTLEGHGYRILTASDGAEGLAVFVQNRSEVRLVLTDMMMPVMGGVTLIRAIHALEPDVKVLATSGLTDQANRLKLEDAGFDSVILKPCNPGELLNTIALQLAKSRPFRVIPSELESVLSG